MRAYYEQFSFGYRHSTANIRAKTSKSEEWAAARAAAGPELETAARKWDIHYNETNIILKHKRRKHSIKIGVGGDVMIDRMINPSTFTFDSKKREFPNAAEAMGFAIGEVRALS
jgi:hypothetical protein